MCECGKGHTVPDPSPWSVGFAGLLELSGKLDGKGGFRERVDAKIVRGNIAFLRRWAVARIHSATVVRIRAWDDTAAVREQACLLVCWLDALAAVQGLAGE
jgi:hypothetical protein